MGVFSTSLKWLYNILELDSSYILRYKHVIKRYLKDYGIDTMHWQTVAEERPTRRTSLTDGSAIDIKNIPDSPRDHVREPLVVYICSLYARSSTRRRVSSGLSDEIFVHRGVRQGDLLSPVLFNAIIDMCIQHIDPNIGVPVGDQTLLCLGFADNLVLLAKSPRGIQHIFTTVEPLLCVDCPPMQRSIVRCASMYLVQRRHGRVIQLPSWQIGAVASYRGLT